MPQESLQCQYSEFFSQDRLCREASTSPLLSRICHSLIHVFLSPLYQHTTTRRTEWAATLVAVQDVLRRRQNINFASVRLLLQCVAFQGVMAFRGSVPGGAEENHSTTASLLQNESGILLKCQNRCMTALLFCIHYLYNFLLMLLTKDIMIVLALKMALDADRA